MPRITIKCRTCDGWHERGEVCPDLSKSWDKDREPSKRLVALADWFWRMADLWRNRKDDPTQTDHWCHFPVKEKDWVAVQVRVDDARQVYCVRAQYHQQMGHDPLVRDHLIDAEAIESASGDVVLGSHVLAAINALAEKLGCERTNLKRLDKHIEKGRLLVIASGA